MIVDIWKIVTLALIQVVESPHLVFVSRRGHVNLLMEDGIKCSSSSSQAAESSLSLRLIFWRIAPEDPFVSVQPGPVVTSPLDQRSFSEGYLVVVSLGR